MGKKHSKDVGQQHFPDKRHQSHITPPPGTKVLSVLEVPPYMNYLNFLNSGFTNIAIGSQFLFTWFWNDDFMTAIWLFGQILPGFIYMDAVSRRVDAMISGSLRDVFSSYSLINVHTFYLRWVMQILVYMWVMSGKSISTQIVTWLFGFGVSFIIGLFVDELRNLPLIGWLFIPMQQLYRGIEGESGTHPGGVGVQANGKIYDEIVKKVE